MPVAGRLKKMSVLYVEDDEVSREAIGRMLSSKIGAVRLAANGQEGLDAFIKDPPDMVITDLEMPVMNGLEMIRRIRGMGHNIPIIITTGYDDCDHRSDLAIRTLIKPIIFKKLIEALEDCVKDRT